MAEEVGATTAVLDPLEGRPDDGDYLTGMRANLARPAHRAGLRVSRPAGVGCAAAPSATARRPVLSGVDLRVEAGEVVAVLGPNGAGKSTLVRAVVGLHPLAGGTLELFGVPADAAARAAPDRLRAAARWAPSSGVPATVREVVLSGRLHALRRWRRAARRRPRARRPRPRGRRPARASATGPVAQLSGGQQQRVLIARALVGDADLLVLDEPTSGVDAASQQALADALDHLRTLHGKGVLLVAHELGPVRPVVSRAVVLRRRRRRARRPARGRPGRASRSRQHDLHCPPARRPAHPRARPRQRAAAVSEMLSYGFMQRALVAALLVGVTAPAVGIFLVQRRLALLGDGIGHVALTGVALGFLLGTAPVLTAVVVASLGAIAIEVHAHRVPAPAATSRSRCCSTAAWPAASCSSAWRPAAATPTCWPTCSAR